MNKNKIISKVYLLPADLNYLVGASGGADSIYMLEHLRLTNYNFAVAHINYNLRTNSWKDQLIVEKYCKKHNLKLYILNISAELKGNLQSKARKIRYDFFSRILKILGFDALIIAHNLNDNIETYTIQRVRKIITNTRGLILLSYLGKMRIFRPLLPLKSQEIRKYLQSNRIKYAIDETNHNKKSYFRNQIRLWIKKFLPQEWEIKKILLLIAVENKIINIHKLLAKEILNKKSINLHKLYSCQSHESSLRAIYFFLQSQGYNNIYTTKKSQIKEIIRVLSGCKKHKFIIPLSRGYFLAIQKEKLTLERKNHQSTSFSRK